MKLGARKRAHPFQKFFLASLTLLDRLLDPPLPICHICNWRGFELMFEGAKLFFYLINVNLNLNILDLDFFCPSLFFWPLSMGGARSRKGSKEKKKGGNKRLEWVHSCYSLHRLIAGNRRAVSGLHSAHGTCSSTFFLFHPRGITVKGNKFSWNSRLNEWINDWVNVFVNRHSNSARALADCLFLRLCTIYIFWHS